MSRRARGEAPAGLRHDHPIFLLRFLRKFLLLALLPLCSALLGRDPEGLRAALRQALALLVLPAGLAGLEYRAAGWAMDGDGALHLYRGILFRVHIRLQTGAVAALQLERPLPCRLLGASVLTLYPAAGLRPRPVTLYLYKRDALRLADAILPPPPAKACRATRAGRLPLALFSANAAATGLLAAWALQKSEGLGFWAEQLALRQLETVARFAAHFLPAGLAWLLTAAGALAVVSLGRGLLRTAGHRAGRSAGVLTAQGGFPGCWQLRIRTGCILWAELRRTPTARLLRQWPVYVAAGCFQGGDVPLTVVPAGRADLLQALLPGFRLPPPAPPSLARGRSIAAFYARSGLLFGFALLLFVLSVRLLPALAPLLALALAAALLFLLICAEGYRTEGGWPVCRTAPPDGEPGLLTARRAAGITLHEYCIFLRPAASIRFQSPWAVRAGRADLTLRFAAGAGLRLRSLPLKDAEKLR